MAERTQTTEIEPHYVMLDDESLDDDEIVRRRTLGERILELVPMDALSRLQILQPAIGCLNRCNFCSQVAGPVTRELDAEAVRTIMGGLRGAMLAVGLDRVGGERMHKDGVIFPYLDNDIGSYPHLPDYLVGMRSLGGLTRISTVGWSRHNSDLQSMHEKIAAEHVNDIDGIRFSLTPYTYGWRTNPDEYLHDFGNALATYRPLFEQKGVGRRTACIEMRFAPDIQTGDIEIRDIGRYKVIRYREYMLAMRQAQSVEGNFSTIATMTAGGPELNQPGMEAVHLVGLVENLDEDFLTELFNTSKTNPRVNERYNVLTHKGKAHVFQNADGPYYCFNPLKDSVDGTFTAVHYYPQTRSRKISGVLDATRPFLNNLLAIKRRSDIAPREDFDTSTKGHVDKLIQSLYAEAEFMGKFSENRSRYIKQQVIPLVEGLVHAMTIANLTPADLFRYGLVVDTGVIVNQGKAISEFKGLASRPDMPMTPNEEKGYGNVSQSSIRGNTWRISPVAMVEQASPIAGYGKKSLPILSKQGGSLSLGVFEWNPQTFNNNDVNGVKLRSLYVPIGDLVNPLEKITPEQGKRGHKLPG